MLKNKMTVGNIPTIDMYVSLFKYAQSKGIKTYKNSEEEWKASYDGGFINISYDSSNQVCGNCTPYGDQQKIWITIDQFIEHCNEFKQSKLELTKLELTSDYTAIIDFSAEIVNVGCQKIPFKKVEELFNLIKK